MTNSLIQLFKNDSVQKVKFGQVWSLASDWSVVCFPWLIWRYRIARAFLENRPIGSEGKCRRRLAVRPKGSTLIRGVRRKNNQSPTQLKLWKWPKKHIFKGNNVRIGINLQNVRKYKPKMKFSKNQKNFGNFFARIFTPLMNHNDIIKTFIFDIYLISFGPKLKN